MSSKPKSAAAQAAALKRLRALSHLLDNSIPIPGVGRIGLDPILGLLPGGGDLFSGLISAYIVIEGARLGAPAASLTRMAFNILLEVFVGSAPILGDLFDAAWKANAKNVELIEAHVQNPQPSRPANPGFVLLLVAGLLAVIIGVIALALRLLSWTLGGLGQ
ncbi:MAG: DUF4112 domain-containing protein [Leptolyngbyaceae cyanobacterium MO_188.B28]|nr:DUF4112 domain-containing protein [Leptolyngbyaceae cyanobacterium MO_188.B28]